MSGQVAEGMDPARLREIAQTLRRNAERVDEVCESGRAGLGVLMAQWSGPDLESFHDRWEDATPQVRETARLMRAAVEDLFAQADAQVEASGGEGGGGRGFGLPEFDLPDLDWPDWDWPDVDWPEVTTSDLSAVWDDFVDLLEDIGDWWDEIPWWGQLIIGVVVVVVVAVLFFLGWAAAAIVAALATIVAIVGAIMTVLDLLDEIAAFLRDPLGTIQRTIDDPLAFVDELIWVVVGALPFGIGKVLQRFRKPLKEFFERIAPTFKKWFDDAGGWARKKWDDLVRTFDEWQDRRTAPQNKRDLDGGLSQHEAAGGHTLDRHVGKSDQDLVDRATPRPGHTPPSGGASSYPSAARAERATADNINANRGEVDDWLADPDGPQRIELTHENGYTTGRHVPAGGTDASDVTGTRVVLVRDSSMPQGYRVVTSYPTP